MKKFAQILILSIFTMIIVGGFSQSAFAAEPTVTFENAPLFGEANFIPGVSISRWIKITNDTEVPHRAIIRALEVSNNDNLGDVVNLEIKQGGTVIYNDTFSNFFKEGEVVLPQVNAGDTNTIDLIATFSTEANNDFQNKIMNFSLQAGLEDVSSSTDTASIVRSRGSSGSNLPLEGEDLVISNEVAIPSNQIAGDVTVSWNTNIPSTSQVVYGLTSDGPYNLDMSSPNFGYPLSTPEQDLAKTTKHIVNITNAPDGEYTYRVISSASSTTTGYEHNFIVSNINLPNINDNAGQVLGAQFNPSTLTQTEADSQNIQGSNNDKTNLLGASAGNIIGLSRTSFIALLAFLLIILILIIRIILKRKNKYNSLK